MDWASVQTGLIDAVRTALGDPSFDVGWIRRESRWRSASHVQLSVLSFTSRGVDERRYTPEGSDDTRERIYGVRRLVVQVMCEAQDQDLIDSSWSTAETIVTRLHGSDVQSILDGCGLGLASVQDPQQTDYSSNASRGGFGDAHNRDRSVVHFDIFFNAHSEITGPLIPTINEIEFSGDVEDGPDVGPSIVEDTTT